MKNDLKKKQRMGKKYRYFTVNKKAHGKVLNP